MLWAGLAGAITVRTVRAGLPFSLTWWSFTFPVGTCVTGTTGLALHTGADLFHYAAALFYAGLVLAWITVAARTARGSLRGTLFVPPAPPPARCCRVTTRDGVDRDTRRLTWRRSGQTERMQRTVSAHLAVEVSSPARLAMQVAVADPTGYQADEQIELTLDGAGVHYDRDRRAERRTALGARCCRRAA